MNNEMTESLNKELTPASGNASSSENIVHLPKISSVLNNCALHAITPEILEVVKRLAAKDEIYAINFLDGYKLFKTCFETYYELEVQEWNKFAEILSSYNSFDLQIILGPVLREFMAEKLRSPELQQRFSQFYKDKTKLTKIQDYARYCDSSLDEVQVLIGNYLGLAISYTDNNGVVYKIANTTFIREIMYYGGSTDGASAGGHWERVADTAALGDPEPSELEPIIDLLGNDKDLTQQGLQFLKEYVKAKPTNVTDRIIQNAKVAKQDYEEKLGLIIEESMTKPLEKIFAIIEGININDIGSHFVGAKQAAMDLKTQLKERTNTCDFNTKKDYDNYIADVKNIIDKAKPILERDLGWGGYLNNIFIAICNTLVGVFTLGCYQGFFAYNKAGAAKAAEDALQNIRNYVTRQSPRS